MKKAIGRRLGILLVPQHPVLALFIIATSYAFMYSPTFADHSDGHNVGFPKQLKIDAFAIANSRTQYLPDPPSGKVTVQLLATVT